MREKSRILLTGVLLGVSFAVVFLAGFLAREFVPMNGIASASGESPYYLMSEVQHLLDRVYLRPQPDYTQRQYAAIRGLLTLLGDPNTFFIEPPVAQSEAHALAGTYGGIGVQVRRNELGEYLLYPFADSPAARAGILPEAILLAVNGRNIELSDHPDAIDQMMRGEVKPDNGVELLIFQEDLEQSFFILFDVINVPSVVMRQLSEDRRIGYIHVMRFTSRTPQEVQDALQSLNNASVEAYILDLRNNGGGLLEESIQIADEFLGAGPVMIEKSRDNERVYSADPDGLGQVLPLVVLVNSQTASASELVAGAIRDSGRGILIGQRTYGKGTVQQIFTLSDGSSVHITSSEWLTPNRSSLAGVGLIPDIEMIPDENGRDVELGEAVRYIQRLLD